MKKLLVIVIISLVFTPFSNAQKLKGNKNVTVENREIDSFNTIIVKSNLKVFLEESQENYVRVETDENLQSAVETRVSNEVLEIYLSQDIRRKKDLNVYVGVTDLLQRIEVLDNAKVTGENTIHTDIIELITEDNAKLEVNILAPDISIVGKDKSDMKLILKTDNNIVVDLDENSFVSMQCSAYKVDVKLTDSASIKPIGNCKELVVVSNGNISLKGKDLLTDYAAVEASDRSNIFVNVAKELIVISENMAEISVYDNPKIFIEKFSDKSTLYKK